MTPLPRFDGVSENGLRFLVLFDLKDVERSNLPVRQWMKTVWACFEGQAFDWINSHKEIRAILQKKLPDENDKKAFKKLICEQYPIGKPAVTKSEVRVKLIDMQQDQDETVKEYYQRIHDALVETGRKDILLSVVIRDWINGLNNKKLARHLISRPANQSSLYDVCIIAERKLRQKEERRLQKKEAQKALQQQLQDIVDLDVARTRKAYESQAVLEQLPCDLSETNAAIVNPSDIESTESTDEVLASGPGKWIAAAAGKEVFGYSSTSDEAAKNPIEASDNSFGWSRCCTVDDVEVLNQEVFALAALYDAFLKNPPAEDMEISVAMDMPSLKHLMDMDGPAIEAFDSGTTLGAHSKNSSIQHTDDSETMEKTSVSVFSDFASDSAYICELPALPAFDLSIDIDFEAYTIDFEVVVQSSVTSRQKMQLSSFRGLALRNISFGWSRCCTNSVGSRTSVSICTSVSDVTSTSTVTSIECATTTVEDIDFYGGEQSLCSPVDVNVDAVLDSVVLIDASILIAGLIKPINNSVWMSLLGSIEYLAPKPKHKGLSKVKIKTIQESEHIESRSHQIVAGIFAGFTY